MGKSRNTPYKKPEWGQHDAPGQWAGIKEFRREHNRKTRSAFKRAVRSSRDWEELDEDPWYQDYRKRGQAKWDFI